MKTNLQGAALSTHFVYKNLAIFITFREQVSTQRIKFTRLFRIFFSDVRKLKHKFAFCRSVGVAVELESLAKL